MIKKILIILVVIGLLGGGGYLYLQDSKEERTDPSATTTEQNAITPNEAKSDNTITILAVGDMLPHDTVNLRAESSLGYNYLPFFDQVSSLVAGADGLFCNQESPSAGDIFSIGGYPSFNAPTQFAEDLNSFGCNIISLANNHMFDRGIGALNATVDTWDGLNTLAVSGANKTEADQTVQLFEIDGIKFAFVAFTESSNSVVSPAHKVNKLEKPLVNKLVGQAKQQADVVLVSVHWLIEGVDTPSASQNSWAKDIVNAGADVIIGSGPHVLQEYKQIKSSDGRVAQVWFSLGNFLSSQLQTNELIGGIAQIQLEKQLDGSVTLLPPAFTPTYMHYEWTAAEAVAQDLLARNNLKIYPLSEAADPLSRSQLNTSVEEQLGRVIELLNRNSKVEVQ